MSAELSLSTAEIQGVADRLDGWDGLSDREREVLHGVFALAGSAIAAAQPEDEVTGFALVGGPDLNGGTFDSFQQGTQHTVQDIRKSAGGGGSGVMFLSFTFKLVAVKTVSWSHDD